jgi:hypothetical protein
MPNCERGLSQISFIQYDLFARFNIRPNAQKGNGNLLKSLTCLTFLVNLLNKLKLYKLLIGRGIPILNLLKAKQVHTIHHFPSHKSFWGPWNEIIYQFIKIGSLKKQNRFEQHYIRWHKAPQRHHTSTSDVINFHATSSEHF